MKTKDFRKELMAVTPGYKWTIHSNHCLSKDGFATATGIQSAGTNRMSTLRVVLTEKNGIVEYSVQSSGHGTKSPWLHEHSDGTLKRALRGLQDYYECQSENYSRHAHDLRVGRKKKQ